MKSLAGDVLLIAAGTAISRLLGLARDASIASRFGASAAYDAFLVAFFAANVLRQLLGEGALATAFVPIYTDLRASGEDADRFPSNLLSLLIVLFPAICAVGIALAPWYVPFLATGFAPDKMALAVSLARVIFPFVAFVGFGAVFMGVLNAHHRFFAPSFAPVWFNVGMIVGAVVLAPRWPAAPVYGLAVGVLLGGAGQLLSQLPALAKARFRFSFSLFPIHSGVWLLLRRMAPAVFILAVSEINLMVDNKLASYLPDGSISALQYGMRLFQLPLGVLAVSIATALLPRLSQAESERDPARFSTYVGDGLAATALVLLPATAGLALLGGDIVRLLFEHGSFVAADTLRTARVLTFYLVGLLPYGWVYVQVRACYALGRTLVPLAAALASVVANVALDLALVGPMKEAGLALATGVAGMINAGVLLVFLRRKTPWSPLLRRLTLIVIGSVAMTGVVFAAQWVTRSTPVVVRVLVPIVLGMSAYGLFVRFTRLWRLVRRVPSPHPS
jgi:putative peptidoglycan lipid II flippase